MAEDPVSVLLCQVTQDCHSRLQVLKDDEFLMKCYNLCVKLKKKKESTELPFTDSDQIEFLRGISQAVLDMTFAIENQLVEEEFPECNSQDRIKQLLIELSQPEAVVKTVFCDRKQVADVLGVDLYECLLWRRGALLYMYCSTVQQVESRVNRHNADFIKKAVEGVGFLQQMLRVRQPYKKDVHFAAGDTLALLQEGIYSDTHMLALMYAGELCSWIKRFLKNTADVGDFNAKEVGVPLLQCYISAVRGPLMGQGWNLDTAERLVEYLQS